MKNRRSVDHVHRRTRPRVERLEPRALLACNVISGFVYNDLNRDGLREPGEPPIANSPVELRDVNGVVVGSTTTDANGFYQFSVDQTLSAAPTTKVETLTFPDTPTNWNKTGTLPQFDPSLGTLTSIDVINTGTVNGRIKVENLDTGPTVITAKDAGTLTASGPGVSSLIVLPLFTDTFNASAFDGTVDFAGTSGHDFGPRTPSDSRTITLTSPSDLALYTGTGNVTLQEGAVSTSTATGAGNIISQVTTSASATISVVYHYIPDVCLRPGQYNIVQTTEPPGFIEGRDTRGNVVPLPISIGPDVIPVTLVNADLTDNNFGDLIPLPPPPPPPQLSSLSGYVFFDANNNGRFDANEFGIAHVVVTLTGTDDRGRAVSQSTTTADDGSYHFFNLQPGTYSLTETEPRLFLRGGKDKDAIGSQGGVVENDRLSSILLKAGVNGVNNDFGERLPPGCKIERFGHHARFGFHHHRGIFGVPRDPFAPPFHAPKGNGKAPLVHFWIPTLSFRASSPGAGGGVGAASSHVNKAHRS